MLAERDAEDLVRLSQALLHAERLAGDLTEWGRHTALVALDGVCEYAMALGLSVCGVRIKRDAKFAALLDDLDSALGDSWRPPARRDLLDMHAARNSAQHGAVLPDPAVFPRWHRAVGVFVRALVRATFDVSLDDVVLASAIRDPGLREAMADTERHVAAGEALDGFNAAVALFDHARRVWRAQQHDAYGWMPVDDWDRPFDLIDAAGRASDLAEVGVFADDLGEYQWLLATRQQQHHGVLVSADDARRAAAFVYRWVLRWQYFDSRYPRDRWQAAYAEFEPPMTRGAGGELEPPKLVGLAFIGRLELAGRRWRRVQVTVANVPERGRGDWGVDMPAALASCASDVGLEASNNAAHGDVLASATEPILGRFDFLLSMEIDGQRARHLLARTVQETTARYDARQDGQLAQETRIKEVTELLHLVASADASGLFGGPEVRMEVRSDGTRLVAHLPVRGDQREVAEVASIFAARGGLLAGTVLDAGGIAFKVPESTPDLREELREAVLAAADEVDRVRGVGSLEAAADDEFIAALARGPE